ncbi:hypothetical protein GPECTOR_146g9 [Gonium pectorale]|uniref:Uncharacterized protein n=1 Tax=Gonium pectorale TaxID=33097 RepID=A0A150FXU1_GONPE|nr:hypothetical protein GPECTOR_146g9 [Gonium pectorale]|eukprot:KXZ42444.1 hypothetical protein GPECTOR_146g9 [Gonium pectorale]
MAACRYVVTGSKTKKKKEEEKDRSISLLLIARDEVVKDGNTSVPHDALLAACKLMDSELRNLSNEYLRARYAVYCMLLDGSKIDWMAAGYLRDLRKAEIPAAVVATRTKVTTGFNIEDIKDLSERAGGRPSQLNTQHGFIGSKTPKNWTPGKDLSLFNAGSSVFVERIANSEDATAKGLQEAKQLHSALKAFYGDNPSELLAVEKRIIERVAEGDTSAADYLIAWRKKAKGVPKLKHRKAEIFTLLQTPMVRLSHRGGKRKCGIAASGRGLASQDAQDVIVPESIRKVVESMPDWYDDSNAAVQSVADYIRQEGRMEGSDSVSVQGYANAAVDKLFKSVHQPRHDILFRYHFGFDSVEATAGQFKAMVNCLSPRLTGIDKLEDLRPFLEGEFEADINAAFLLPISLFVAMGACDTLYDAATLMRGYLQEGSLKEKLQPMSASAWEFLQSGGKTPRV